MYGNQPNRDCVEELTQWWKNVPIFTAFVGIFELFLFLLLFFPFFEENWTILRLDTFLNGYFWTILTYPYQNPTLLRTAFSLFMYLPLAAASERRNGTVRYIFFFLFTSLLTGIIFLAVSYFLLPHSGLKYYLIGSGLWGQIMTETVLSCYEKPNENGKILTCNCPIRNKFIPWIYLVLLTIFSFNFILIFIGTALGFLCNF